MSYPYHQTQTDYDQLQAQRHNQSPHGHIKPHINPCPPPITPDPSHYLHPLTVTTCPPTAMFHPHTETRSPSPP
jgi:hypothetical protein